MLAARYDIVLQAGDTWIRDLHIEINGVDADITGWAWSAHIRTDYFPDGELVGEFTIEPNVETSTVRLILSPEVSGKLPGNCRLVWDLEARGSNVQTWLYGGVKVRREVTRV